MKLFIEIIIRVFGTVCCALAVWYICTALNVPEMLTYFYAGAFGVMGQESFMDTFYPFDEPSQPEKNKEQS